MSIPRTVPGLITAVIYSDDRWAGLNRPIWFVVHSPEHPEIAQAARAVARYLATSSRVASVHFCGDNVEAIRCADDTDKVAGAGGGNTLGLHYECTGYAGQSAAEWLDPYSRGALLVMARVFALAHAAWGIPAVVLTDDDVRAMRPGIVTHAQLVRVFGGDHWDPGPNFPMDYFLGLCRGQIGVSDLMDFGEWFQQFNAAKPDTYDPVVEFVQRGLRKLGHYGPRYRVDGKRGPITLEAWRRFEQSRPIGRGNAKAGESSWSAFVRRLGLGEL